MESLTAKALGSMPMVISMLGVGKMASNMAKALAHILMDKSLSVSSRTATRGMALDTTKTVVSWLLFQRVMCRRTDEAPLLILPAV